MREGGISYFFRGQFSELKDPPVPCPGALGRPPHRSAAHQRTSIRDQTVGSGRAFIERTACKKQVGAASTHFVPSTKGDYYSCTTRGSIRRNQVVALPLIVLVEAIGGIDLRGACASLPAVLHVGSAGAKAPRAGHSRCDPSNFLSHHFTAHRDSDSDRLRGRAPHRGERHPAQVPRSRRSAAVYLSHLA